MLTRCYYDNSRPSEKERETERERERNGQRVGIKVAYLTLPYSPILEQEGGRMDK